MTHKRNLIITRKRGDSVDIGDDVTVQVLWVRGRKVKLSIKAPDGVPIVRDDANVKEAIVERVADQG